MDREQRKIEMAEQAGRMQAKILDHLEAKLDDGSINATELKTAVDLLRANGWDWQGALESSGLKAKLTKHVKYDDDIDGTHYALAH